MKNIRNEIEPKLVIKRLRTNREYFYEFDDPTYKIWRDILESLKIVFKY